MRFRKTLITAAVTSALLLPSTTSVYAFPSTAHTPSYSTTVNSTVSVVVPFKKLTKKLLLTKTQFAQITGIPEKDLYINDSKIENGVSTVYTVPLRNEDGTVKSIGSYYAAAVIKLNKKGDGSWAGRVANVKETTGATVKTQTKNRLLVNMPATETITMPVWAELRRISPKRATLVTIAYQTGTYDDPTALNLITKLANVQARKAR